MKFSQYLDDQDITLQEFADRIHRSIGYVCDIVNGKTFPGPETQELILLESGGLVTPTDLLRDLRPELKAKSRSEARRGLPGARGRRGRRAAAG
jgi:transcriptional regulator with XRE-family HTH domain